MEQTTDGLAALFGPVAVPVEEPGRRLLRVEEAAERLGIGRTLMYRLVLHGDVGSVTVGRLRRIPSECLDEYVESLRVNTDTTAAAGE